MRCLCLMLTFSMAILLCGCTKRFNVRYLDRGLIHVADDSCSLGSILIGDKDGKPVRCNSFQPTILNSHCTGWVAPDTIKLLNTLNVPKTELSKRFSLPDT